MGKNKAIKSIGRVIGNIVVHKITFKYTNNPESRNHIFSEIGTYRDNALEIAQEFNWNEADKQSIKEESVKEFNRRIKKYNDVQYPEKEVSELIEETIKESFLHVGGAKYT